MKKTLLSLGTIVSAIAPVASVIACGDGDVPGHEAPYKITISADESIPTQANVLIRLKGFVSDSYIKEIKSRIAESIAAANKDELKYKTMEIFVESLSSPIDSQAVSEEIKTSPLTSANKNDLEAIYNLINSHFDNLVNRAKNHELLKHFFEKKVWENNSHAIDKADQDEIKKKLLKLFGFRSTNPNWIDFKYGIISNKYIDFTITRTNVPASPELYQQNFSRNTQYFPLLEGESINISMNIPEDGILDIRNDLISTVFNSKTINKNGELGVNSNTVKVEVMIYRMFKLLLKKNEISNNIKLKYGTIGESKYLLFDEITSGNSATKLFGHGDNGRKNWLLYNTSENIIEVDLDKKAFKINVNIENKNEKQWVFGKNGDHLIIEPTKIFTLSLEGTYNLNGTNDDVESIPSLTKATATDGTKTIQILESSGKSIAKDIFQKLYFFI